MSAAAQDWYHERDERLPREAVEIPHEIESGTRLERPGERQRTYPPGETEEELTKMQADLAQRRLDKGILNDVIDSIRKTIQWPASSTARSRHIADDLMRLKDYQDHHDGWR